MSSRARRLLRAEAACGVNSPPEKGFLSQSSLLLRLVLPLSDYVAPSPRWQHKGSTQTHQLGRNLPSRQPQLTCCCSRQTVWISLTLRPTEHIPPGAPARGFSLLKCLLPLPLPLPTARVSPLPQPPACFSSPRMLLQGPPPAEITAQRCALDFLCSSLSSSLSVASFSQSQSPSMSRDPTLCRGVQPGEALTSKFRTQPTSPTAQCGATCSTKTTDSFLPPAKPPHAETVKERILQRNPRFSPYLDIKTSPL